MPWAGNIAKTMMLKVKQFTIKREMFTAVAVVIGGCRMFSLDHESVLLYNKSVDDWSRGKQWYLFPFKHNWISIKILEKQNLLFPSGPVINC